MSPPLTPEDIVKLRAIIRDEVATSERKTQKQITELQGVDTRFDTDLRKHSGTHKDIVANVRESEEKIKSSTAESMLLAQVHMAGALEDFRAESNEKIHFLHRQVAALQSLPAQATASANASIDTQLAVNKGQTEGRWRTAVVLLGLLISTVISALLKGSL